MNDTGSRSPAARWLLLSVCVLCAAAAAAMGTYEEPEAFLNTAFSGDPPAPRQLWIDRELKEEIRQILGHDLGVLRLRYWGRDRRTAWILEKIGKDKPITTGIVVNDGRIEQLKVLIFRETRGWEVRYPFFTDQFTGAALADDNSLDTHIDGISGATLSVNALTHLARLALLLDQNTRP